MQVGAKALRIAASQLHDQLLGARIARQPRGKQRQNVRLPDAMQEVIRQLAAALPGAIPTPSTVGHDHMQLRIVGRRPAGRLQHHAVAQRHRLALDLGDHGVHRCLCGMPQPIQQHRGVLLKE